MITKIDHVGIVVKSIDEMARILSCLPGLGIAHTETLPSHKVKIAMVPVGQSKIELLQPTDGDSALAQLIAQKGEGIHHLALEVDDIEATLSLLKERGVPLIDSKPRAGAGGDRIAFLDPKGTGVLLELVQH